MEALQAQQEKGVLLPRCSICGQVPSQGIHGGLKLKKFFLCRKCEWSILTVEIGSPDYDHIIGKLRSIIKA